MLSLILALSKTTTKIKYNSEHTIMFQSRMKNGLIFSIEMNWITIMWRAQ